MPEFQVATQRWQLATQKWQPKGGNWQPQGVATQEEQVSLTILNSQEFAMGMGIREYARYRGISHTAVQKAIKSGRISVESDGTIDPVKTDVAWEHNTDQAMQRKHVSEPPTPAFIPPDLSSKPAPRPTPNTTAEPEAGPSGSLVPNYQANRAIREAYAARTARLDYEERMGTLLKKTDVEADAFACNRRTRDRIQSIPSRVASVLSSMTDALAIERLLDKELYDALEELSR